MATGVAPATAPIARAARKAARALPPARPGTPPIEVAVIGTLLEHAVMRVTPATGAPEVTVLLAQPGCPPLRATLAYPPGASSQIVAGMKARTLRAGMQVQVRGAGLSWRPRMAALHLDHVTSLQPLLQPHSAAMAAANDIERITP
jgi:hypothetical protein